MLLVLLAGTTWPLALLHQFKRLAVRWERRLERQDSVLSPACAPHLPEEAQQAGGVAV
ncbi:hypothetical protein PUR61_12350 [Streptomyces sp. BE20]|uniref:hypothetical protein n=1 Tax=Streptomyces sp. BE303 TaxID=3002528 RepID=UPI002E7937C3|nr:hypothetical protein [Streptomyces sp. BE303]MED7948865.1 hypothetical protein [Streptomyces sp. BE303]MEE1822975.1 hypothetical protein [Streptomyces sp. BE20]